MSLRVVLRGMLEHARAIALHAIGRRFNPATENIYFLLATQSWASLGSVQCRQGAPLQPAASSRTLPLSAASAVLEPRWHGVQGEGRELGDGLAPGSPQESGTQPGAAPTAGGPRGPHSPRARVWVTTVTPSRAPYTVTCAVHWHPQAVWQCAPKYNGVRSRDPTVRPSVSDHRD